MVLSVIQIPPISCLLASLYIIFYYNLHNMSNYTERDWCLPVSLEVYSFRLSQILSQIEQSALQHGHRASQLLQSAISSGHGNWQLEQSCCSRHFESLMILSFRATTLRFTHSLAQNSQFPLQHGHRDLQMSHLFVSGVLCGHFQGQL